MESRLNGAVIYNDRHAPICCSNSKKQPETFNLEPSKIRRNESNMMFLSVNKATLL